MTFESLQQMDQRCAAVLSNNVQLPIVFVKAKGN